MAGFHGRFTPRPKEIRQLPVSTNTNCRPDSEMTFALPALSPRVKPLQILRTVGFQERVMQSRSCTPPGVASTQAQHIACHEKPENSQLEFELTAYRRDT